MSEGCKMGLFGSKDKNQEHKDISAKDSSPARYAPYCIDSDTETYDTEALSIMEINDIIGVQSEQAGDSTLESEIAALSQIITDSKVESVPQPVDHKPQLQQDSARAPGCTSSMIAETGVPERLAQGCEKEKGMDDCLHKSAIGDNIFKQHVAEAADDTFAVSMLDISDNKSLIKVDSTSEQVGIASPARDGENLEDTMDESGKVEAKSDISESSNCIKPVVTIASISKSLQLIGEAYISDDSEEMNTDDNDSLKGTLSLPVSEDAPTNVSSVQREESDSAAVDASEENAEDCIKSSSEEIVGSLGKQETKVEDIIEKSMENLTEIAKTEEQENSSQIEASEKAEDDSTSASTVKCDDNSTLSSKCEQSECDGVEVSKVDVTKGSEIDENKEILLKDRSSSMISVESASSTLANSSDSALPEETIEDVEKIEDKEEDSCSAFDKSNSLNVEEIINVERYTVDDNTTELTEDTSVCKSKDTLSTTQDSASIEIPDNISDVENRNIKNDQPEEIHVIAETSQIHEAISTDAACKDTRETTVTHEDIKITSAVLDTQDNIDLSTDVKDTFDETTTTDEKPNVKKGITKPLTCSDDEEKECGKEVNALSIGDCLSIEESAVSVLSPTDSMTQNETNVIPTGIDHLEEASVEKDICTEIEQEQSVERVSREKLKADDTNDTVSTKSENIHSDTKSDDRSNDTVDKINLEALHEVQKVQNTTVKITSAENGDETLSGKEVSKEEINQPELRVQDNEQTSCVTQSDDKLTVKSVTSDKMLLGDDTNLSLVDTSIISENERRILLNATQGKEEMAKMTEISSDEVKMSRDKTIVLSSTEESVAECSESVEEGNEIAETNLLAAAELDDKIRKMQEGTNLRTNEAACREEKYKELVDVDATSIVEWKDLKATMEKSDDILKDDKLNGASSELAESARAEQSSTERDESVDSNHAKEDKSISDDTEDTTDAKVFTEKQSPRNAITNVTNDIANNEKDTLETEKNVESEGDTAQKSADTPLNTDSQEFKALCQQTDSECVGDTITRQNSVSPQGILDLAVASTNQSSLKNFRMEADGGRNNDLDADPSSDQTDEKEATVREGCSCTTKSMADSSSSKDEDVNDETAEGNVDRSSKVKAETHLNTDAISSNEGKGSPGTNGGGKAATTEPEDNGSASFDDDPVSKLALSRDASAMATENSQSSSEISELESAVKFLQESEEQTVDSPLALSPKMVASVVEDITKHASDEADGYTNVTKPTEAGSVVADPILICEAEIISEAAKLEKERELAARMRDAEEETKASVASDPSPARDRSREERVAAVKARERIPRVSILEERLKEPPKIEIPVAYASGKLSESTISPNDSLLMPKDTRTFAHSRTTLAESPQPAEPRTLLDTPRKDAAEKQHDFENVGSPRIILKIAKSAIADCGEPRSPKSPKIRSAANSPNPDDSPGQKLGKIKLKLSKGGHPSIISNENVDEAGQWHAADSSASSSPSPIGVKIKLSKCGDASIVQQEPKELLSKQGSPKRTESPIGVKIKLSRSGDASIIQTDRLECNDDHRDTPAKRTDSPIGVKIKLSRTGDASIVSTDVADDARVKEKPDHAESSIGVKIKLAKCKGGASVVSLDATEDRPELADSPRCTASPLGMKIKLSRSGDASIVHSVIADDAKDAEEAESAASSAAARTKVAAERSGTEDTTEERKAESPIGVKIKLSRSGDASIVPAECADDHQARSEHAKADSPLGMKIKLLKTGDASVVESERKDKPAKRREAETSSLSSSSSSSLEMKIKLSKSGHATIVACDNHADAQHRSKEPAETSALNLSQRYKEQPLKILKAGHSSILQGNRSELTIEPVHGRKMECPMEVPKRKEVTISPVDSKKFKLEAQLSQILPEVTIQPVICRDQKQQQQQQQQQLLFDPKTSLISRQQMNVISQEISITQVRPTKATDGSMSEKLKDILGKNATNSPVGSDCEIIEQRPELIIVNENSNSSQDVVIIEEVTPNRPCDIKIPKKRGRPRRKPLAQQLLHAQMLMPRDPLALDGLQQVPQFAHRENERPKRTCRSQKSYAPPKRGRGRGRGKRKLDSVDIQIGKKARIEQDLSAIEASTMAVITIDEMSAAQDPLRKSSELYKALKQPPMDRKGVSEAAGQQKRSTVEANAEKLQKAAARQHAADSKNAARMLDGPRTQAAEIKEILIPPGHSNWLTPTSKKQAEASIRGEIVSTVQVIDEETRMSAESCSRSQTPARNIPAPASETIINEESQGSVVSTATTESEKVKVKNRRMEINFDPDEGPFTVDKIAEYEWPLDRKGETFMIQEQISQYLGVKSFKRKYPDLKRRMVDMEERNYLRENGLVSEAMCDMGLTAVCSSEVLDVMCSDFPDQYEEYRKHMREKQVKEHSKKQKELTAAANAERNRIDLAEMAVQSALAWNVNLNKARKENRKCCLDLQTFTIHVPKKEQKVDAEHKVNHYPVALIPGQYTDYYREYTSAELRYYPLNTVLYGPMRPNERKFDSQSEGSQTDSDTESSSDDSSSSSSEGTQDTEGSQSTMDEVDMEIVTQKDVNDVKFKCKMCLKILNKNNKNEILIQCGTCSGNVHPSCIDLTLDMVPHIQSYAWQCTDCKTCAQCHDPADEDKMLFCDMCDRGYHIYCVGLRRVPQGRWHCQECAVCANCGSREPGGINSDRNSVAQWQHEYKKGEKNTRVYVSTFCIPCSKLWRKGRYCPHCSRCHTAQRLDLETNLVHCSACDKYLHLDCVETKGVAVDKKNYLCDFCAPSTRQVIKPLISKLLKT